jgi:hypothetical protein
MTTPLLNDLNEAVEAVKYAAEEYGYYGTVEYHQKLADAM